ncbi:hypothetical protein CU669_00275 [Paramagnetospirillum kuznetsovii]|uniref:SGNH hydrolase-type esterase domain-containing protein n=1 Tax=Paramagnetospirillum kuznetsovii TaxID=2053833 RepID=A0A364P2J9_9PROT|nr:SGNH/GDSL hydrolase family protein [Paramagnetospirillum kuznetsovii]RAU23579.1 hypothetical protein CU669_00275 [Paramagnetospirillum kuznetsovii]
MGDILIRRRHGPDWPSRLARITLATGAIAALLGFALVLRARDHLPDGTLGLVIRTMPLAVAGFLTLSLALPRGARLQLAIILVAMAAGLWGAEGFLAWKSGTVQNDGRAISDVVGDSRTKLQVITALRAQGRDAYPALFPAYILRPNADGSLASPIVVDGKPILPLGGAANVETVVCNENGNWLVYTADERGFANPKGTWSQPGLDLALMGDSFAQGYCVEPDQSFAGRLRARYPATLNLAMSGNGPLIELAALVEYLPERKPREVLWFFCEGNDIPENLAVERRAEVLLRALDGGSQGLDAIYPELDTSVRAYLERMLAKGEASVDAGPMQTVIGIFTLSHLRIALRLPTASDKPDWPLFERIMSIAHERTTGWGGRLTLVYLPGWTTAMGAGAQLAEQRAIHDGVAATVQRLGIPMIDLTPRFAAHADKTALFARRRPNHYSETGHALVAEAVLEDLEKRP